MRPLHLKNEIYFSYFRSHTATNTLSAISFSPALAPKSCTHAGLSTSRPTYCTIRPTILTAVPRVLEVIRARVLSQVARQPRWKQRLFNRAIEIGLKRGDGTTLSLAEQLIDPVLQRLVRAKDPARFGGRLKAAVSGGRAPCNLTSVVSFSRLGMTLLQGYGQTEAGPVISATRPDAIIDTVGPPLLGVDFVSRTMAKSWSEAIWSWTVIGAGPQDTALAIQDGWLHTGDIGSSTERQPADYDRKKDMIVLSGGENVSPAKIEGMLMAEPEIAQAVVAGDGRRGLTALLVPARRMTR